LERTILFKIILKFIFIFIMMIKKEKITFHRKLKLTWKVIHGFDLLAAIFGQPYWNSWSSWDQSLTKLNSHPNLDAHHHTLSTSCAVTPSTKLNRNIRQTYYSTQTILLTMKNMTNRWAYNINMFIKIFVTYT
jgi:hypothetical protein